MNFIDILSCSAVAVVLTGLFNIVEKAIERRAKRKEKKEFDVEQEINSVKEYVQRNDSNLGDLKRGLKFVLYVKIRELGLKYLSDGSIDFDDREMLNDMHKSYHFGLGGNGDLDKLMESVNNLPLKLEKGNKD